MKTERSADQLAMTVFVPERSKIEVSITAASYTINLPYTAWLEKVYYDGTRARKFTKGIFDGVDMKEYMIQERIYDSGTNNRLFITCLLYTSPSPRDGLLSRMPSSA